MGSNCCSKPVSSHAAFEEHYSGGLVIEVFDNSDKVGTDAEILKGCPQSCKPNPVKGLLEVYAGIVEALLVLEICLTNDSFIKDLLCGAPYSSESACSSVMMFSVCSFNLFRMTFSMTAKVGSCG